MCYCTSRYSWVGTVVLFLSCLKDSEPTDVVKCMQNVVVEKIKESSALGRRDNIQQWA